MAFVETRLGRLNYESHGKAKRPGDPPVVLLHGLMFDNEMWRAQVEPLARLGRVILIDGPGHGKSAPAPKHTMEEHADALADAFAGLGVERGIVVGLSWGGYIAMRFALQHPKLVAALGLLDTSLEADNFFVRMQFHAFIVIHRLFGMPYWLFERALAPMLFAPNTVANRRDLLDRQFERTMSFDRAGMVGALRAVTNRTRLAADRLRQIKVPTLVLCGREDVATPVADHETIAAAIAGSTFVIIEGAGHVTSLEAPDEVNLHLTRFVSGYLASLGDEVAAPAA